MNQKLATSEKYSLTIKEAADYFGIGIKRLRRLAEDHLGTFSAYNGNRYLIIRADFEQYLKKSPIMQKPKEEGDELKRVMLEDKSIFNTEEAILFYDLSRRKFKKLLEGEEEVLVQAPVEECPDAVYVFYGKDCELSDLGEGLVECGDGAVFGIHVHEYVDDFAFFE